MRAAVPYLVLAILVTATVAAGRSGQDFLRRQPRPVVAALPAIPFLEVVSLGYREAAADLAWMQAVQYYGQHRQGQAYREDAPTPHVPPPRGPGQTGPA